MKVTKRLAVKIAEKLDASDLKNWDAIRDYCDGYTLGEVDSFQLDLLTDFVSEELGVETG